MWPQLSAQLTYLLKRALVGRENSYAEHLAPIRVSGRELGVLLLWTAVVPSRLQAAGCLGVHRTTMVALLDRLDAKGSWRAIRTPGTVVATLST